MLMADPNDKTDTSIIWNDGEPKGKTVNGVEVDSPQTKASTDDEKLVATADTPQTDTDTPESEVDEREDQIATADSEKENDEETPPEEKVDVGLPAEGEPPSPPEDLKENTNVETDAILDAVDNADNDGPNGPQTSNLEVSGNPTPVSSPNPEPGNPATAPLASKRSKGS